MKHFSVLLLTAFMFTTGNPVQAQKAESKSNTLGSFDWVSFTLTYPKSFPQLVVTSATNENESLQFLAFYSQHKEQIGKNIKERNSHIKNAKIIFEYLHREVFKTYNLHSTVSSLVNNKQYNCVTATSFFVSIAEEFDIPYKIYESPMHVYASVIDGKDEAIVELTLPKSGFDFNANNESIIQTLVNSKLISRDELEQKGADELFREYVEDTFPVSKKELLAIQYYNDGLLLQKQMRYEESFQKFGTALKLYQNSQFSKAYETSFRNSQNDFSLLENDKVRLVRLYLESTQTDSILSKNFVYHLATLIDKLLKNEDNFDEAEKLIHFADREIYPTATNSERITELKSYFYTSKAENAALKGETRVALEYLQQAMEFAPLNTRLRNYSVSLTSNYALQLAHLGQLKKSRNIIDSLHVQYPVDFPVVADARVQIIIAGLVPLQKNEANADEFSNDLALAKSIHPENIYLKSFSSIVFHELAMQQIRKANYPKAKDYILEGLSFHSSDGTLRSDLELINSMLEK